MFSYCTIKKVGHQLAGAALSLLACAATSPGDTVPPRDRASKLEKFFESHHCPSPRHTEDYLRAADANHLDYRLLPAISIIETQCGSSRRLNNRWGWTLAKHDFPTVRSGIDFVAAQLANGYFYRDKTTYEKLLAYNPSPRYAQVVKHLMEKIERMEGAHEHQALRPVTP